MKNRLSSLFSSCPLPNCKQWWRFFRAELCESVTCCFRCNLKIRSRNDVLLTTNIHTFFIQKRHNNKCYNFITHRMHLVMLLLWQSDNQFLCHFKMALSVALVMWSNRVISLDVRTMSLKQTITLCLSKSCLIARPLSFFFSCSTSYMSM